MLCDEREKRKKKKHFSRFQYLSITVKYFEGGKLNFCINYCKLTIIFQQVKPQNIVLKHCGVHILICPHSMLSIIDNTYWIHFHLACSGLLSYKYIQSESLPYYFQHVKTLTHSCPITM